MSTRYWTEDEDTMLLHHVTIHGEANWGIVERLIGRKANSCYIRWRDQLNPDIDHSDITDVEFITILLLLDQYGPEWSKIAKKLSEGRPDNLIRTANKIKNFWNGTVKKRASELNLEVDSDLFLVTMTNILTPPTTTPADFGGQGLDYTLDDAPPFKWKDINEALDYLYQ